MKFASLGSGSEGNALLVQAEDGTRVLVDCGFGPREALKRLSRLGVEPPSLAGILVTHEHSDHVGGVFRLATRYQIPVMLTRGTLLVCGMNPETAAPGAVRILAHGESLRLNGLLVEPFTVPHDAREPVQYVLSDGVARLGVLTDIGHATAQVARSLAGLTALVLETNHDRQLLDASDYPESLKRRISGPWGHLENDQSAALLAMLDRSRLACVVAAHLSRRNNRPEKARAALAAVMGWSDAEIRVADQDEGLGWTSAVPA